MRIGAHVPAQTNFHKMFSYAHEVGCECLQFFTKAPVIWEGKPLTSARIDEFCAAHAKHDELPCLIHGSYLINLISDKSETRIKAVKGLAHEIMRGAQLGVYDLNIHTGSSSKYSPGQAASALAEGIALAYDFACDELGPAAREVRLILENTAGGGSSYGTTITELAQIIYCMQASPAQVGICIDTCHAWAGGYRIDTHSGWDRLIEELDSTCGLEFLQWIHANDSVYGWGTRKDRHAWIGQGEIGLQGFEIMCTHPQLEHVNVVVEMPGAMPIKDQRNIELLKALRDNAPYSHLLSVTQNDLDVQHSSN